MQHQDLSALSALPLVPDLERLQVTGTRGTQEDGPLTDGDDLPNLLFTCQRAIIDGPASTSRGGRVAAVSEGSPGG